MWVDSRGKGRGGVGVSLPFTNASGKENWKELDICEQELTSSSMYLDAGPIRGLHPVTSDGICSIRIWSTLCIC